MKIIPLIVLVSFASLCLAFEKGDEVVVLHDARAKFYDTFSHVLKAGEKIRVAKHDKSSGAVYFLFKDADGKQIALNVPESMVGTASEYEAGTTQSILEHHESEQKELLVSFRKFREFIELKKQKPDSIPINEMESRIRRAIDYTDTHIAILEGAYKISMLGAQKMKEYSSTGEASSVIDIIADEAGKSFCRLATTLEDRAGVVTFMELYPGLIDDGQHDIQNQLSATLTMCVLTHGVMANGLQDYSSALGESQTLEQRTAIVEDAPKTYEGCITIAKLHRDKLRILLASFSKSKPPVSSRAESSTEASKPAKLPKGSFIYNFEILGTKLETTDTFLSDGTFNHESVIDGQSSSKGDGLWSLDGNDIVAIFRLKGKSYSKSFRWDGMDLLLIINEDGKRIDDMPARYIPKK